MHARAVRGASWRDHISVRGPRSAVRGPRPEVRDPKRRVRSWPSRGFRLPPSREALRRTAVALAEAGQAEERASFAYVRNASEQAMRTFAAMRGNVPST